MKVAHESRNDKKAGTCQSGDDKELGELISIEMSRIQELFCPELQGNKEFISREMSRTMQLNILETT